MTGSHGIVVEERMVETLELTQDEAAVIQTIRKTPYGEVIAETRKGAIVNIRRHEMIKPPSLDRQPKLLSGSES